MNTNRPSARSPRIVTTTSPVVPLLGLVGAGVPDRHRAAAVLAGRDLAGKSRYSSGWSSVRTARRGRSPARSGSPLGTAQRRQDAVALEADVVVQPAGVVLLDHETVPRVGVVPADLPERLGGAAGVPFVPIGPELAHATHPPCIATREGSHCRGPVLLIRSRHSLRCRGRGERSDGEYDGDGTRPGGGRGARAARGPPGRRPGAAAQEDLQPLPLPRRGGRPRGRRPRPRPARRRRGPHGRRRGHDDLRGPGRRDPAARADAARGARSCAPSPSAERWWGSASSRARSATACPTSR